MSNSFIWPIDRTLSGTTTLGKSGLGSNVNEGVLHIPQRSSITEASPSDCLVSYLEYLCQRWWWWWTCIPTSRVQRCCCYILQPQPTGLEFIFYFLPSHNKGGARGVMVIVAGNGHGDASSNPGQDWLHFT